MILICDVKVILCMIIILFFYVCMYVCNIFNYNKYKYIKTKYYNKEENLIYYNIIIIY